MKFSPRRVQPALSRKPRLRRISPVGPTGQVFFMFTKNHCLFSCEIKIYGQAGQVDIHGAGHDSQEGCWWTEVGLLNNVVGLVIL